MDNTDQFSSHRQENAENRGIMNIKAFDHPLLFVLFVTMAVLGMQAALTWGFKELGWNGAAAFVQHP